MLIASDTDSIYVTFDELISLLKKFRVVYKENEWLTSWIDCKREKIEPFIDKVIRTC